ncbi:unnamed protein product [Arctia plantaginis]|uniref:Uncharacterized protein n=1 Tax=Arctia plantaginis TaxID=874455 RepID=A0A8S0ZMY9_ARCPL|nr:unnamed protein product [Arctia plantaginis]
MSQWPLITLESRRVSPGAYSLATVKLWSLVLVYSRTHLCWPQTKFWYSVAVLTAPRYVIFETHPLHGPASRDTPVRRAASDIFSCNAPTDCTCTAVQCS